MKVDEAPIVVEHTFRHPAAKIWRAISEPAQMRLWFFDAIPDFKAEVGFATEFMVDAGERQFLHQWQVTEVVLHKKLAYRWHFAGYPGTGVSVFELTESGRTTQLRLSFLVEEDFPEDVPEFERESGMGGWLYFITEQLPRYLDINP